MDTISLWEQEIEDNNIKAEKAIAEATAYMDKHFGGHDLNTINKVQRVLDVVKESQETELLTEGFGAKLKALFNKAQKSKNMKKKSKKEIVTSAKSEYTPKEIPEEEKEARGKLYDEAVKVFAKVVNKHAKNDPNFTKGFFALKNGSMFGMFDVKEDFMDGDSSLTIGRYDAWGYTDNQARTPEKYDEFIEALNKFEPDVKAAFKDWGSIELDCDWDDGVWKLTPTADTIKKYMK